MRRIGLTAILSVALVLALLAASQAEPPSFLYGKVATETGTPVKNQPVVIEGHTAWADNWLPWTVYMKRPWGRDIRVHAVTDDKGAFQVLNLPAGIYSLKALRLGGEPVLIREFTWDGSSKEIAGKVSREKLIPVAGATTTNTMEK